MQFSGWHGPMEIVSTPLNKVVSRTYPSQFCWFLKQIGSCNNKIPCRRGIQHNFLIPKNRDPQLKQAVSSTRKINQQLPSGKQNPAIVALKFFGGTNFAHPFPVESNPGTFHTCGATWRSCASDAITAEPAWDYHPKAVKLVIDGVALFVHLIDKKTNTNIIINIYIYAV